MTTGLIVPNDGHVFIDDEEITKYPVYKRAQAGIGYLPQEASVFRKMSVCLLYTSTGIGGYVPDYVLGNEELSRMVDTSDEWIMARVGIKERRILTEEGLGTSYMARKAAKQLLQKTGVDPNSIDALIVTTTTPDYKFPSTASIVIGKLGLQNAFGFDFSAACCGFLYTLDVASRCV